MFIFSLHNIYLLIVGCSYMQARAKKNATNRSLFDAPHTGGSKKMLVRGLEIISREQVLNVISFQIIWILTIIYLTTCRGKEPVKHRVGAGLKSGQKSIPGCLRRFWTVRSTGFCTLTDLTVCIERAWTTNLFNLLFL